MEQGGWLSHGFYGPRPRVSRFSRWLNTGMLKKEKRKSRSLNELERNSETVLENTTQPGRLSGSNMDCASRVRDLAISCCACTRDAWNRDALSLSRWRPSLSLPHPWTCYNSLEEWTFRFVGPSRIFAPHRFFSPRPTMDVASSKVFITRNYAPVESTVWENISLPWSTREIYGRKGFSPFLRNYFQQVDE